jgi:hypothetical protein
MLYDPSTRKAIALGMKRTQIERILGKGTQRSTGGAGRDIYDYGKTSVVYNKDGMSVAIRTRDEKFQTMRGIRVNDSSEQLKGKYGEPAAKGSTSYPLIKQDGKYSAVDLSTIDLQGKKNEICVIYFVMDFETGISEIEIGTYNDIVFLKME